MMEEFKTSLSNSPRGHALLKVLKENGFTDLKWLGMVVCQFVNVITGRICKINFVLPLYRTKTYTHKENFASNFLVLLLICLYLVVIKSVYIRY